MRWPNGSVTQPQVTSAFGPRKAPVGGASTFHRGVDFIGWSQIRAVASGRVIARGTPSGWSGGGVQVWIQHDGFISRYCHLSSIAGDIQVGTNVNEGDFLGIMGKTGNVSGVHLHEEIAPGSQTANGVQVDPVPFTRARLSGNVAGGATSWVSQYQLDLNTTGFGPLTVDGDYGPATKAATERFQGTHGLKVDGDAGPATLAKMKEVVTHRQEQLKKVGYTIIADGQSGPATIGAIKDFQGKQGVEQDGMIGPITGGKLDAAAAQEVGYNAIPDVRPTPEIQRKLGIPDDGIYGPGTTAAVKAAQTAAGIKADGIYGLETDKVVFPINIGDISYLPLETDGVPGLKTWWEFSKFLGVTPSGTLNDEMIRQMQRDIGLTGDDVDADWGEKTTRYLQSSLGARIDGALGTETYSALQARINSGIKLTYVPFSEAPIPAATKRENDYPFAVDSWNVPLNKYARTTKIVDAIFAHHTAATADQLAYFKTLNSRNSCPSLYAEPKGLHGLIPLSRRPSSTQDNNDHSIAIEMLNKLAGPTWEIDAATVTHVARFIAWVYSKRGQEIGEGVIISPTFEIDAAHVRQHSEVYATACPGPWMQQHWSAMLDEARAIYKAEFVTPEPEPEPEPEPSSKTLVDTEWLRELQLAAGKYLGG